MNAEKGLVHHAGVEFAKGLLGNWLAPLIGGGLVVLAGTIGAWGGGAIIHALGGATLDDLHARLSTAAPPLTFDVHPGRATRANPIGDKEGNQYFEAIGDCPNGEQVIGATCFVEKDSEGILQNAGVFDGRSSCTWHHSSKGLQASVTPMCLKVTK